MHTPKPHAIVFPYPYQGHITPTINLVIKLASYGFTITYVHTEIIHHTISKAQRDSENVDFFDEARKLGHDIRYTTISDGFPIEFDRDQNLTKYWESMIRDFPARVDEFVEKILSSDGSGEEFFLIADTLYTWPSTIAKKHNLVHVSLWTEPALVFSINYHLDLLRQNGHFPYRGNEEYHIKYIPGVLSINRKDLMSYILHPDVMPILVEIVTKAFVQVKKADFILLNTVQELESPVISKLHEKQPMYAVGPINFFTNFTNPIFTNSLWPESDCTQWLSSKPHGSVLYISFGSIGYIGRKEIQEIAHGLLLSQVNFIWVIRPGSIGSNDDANIFPVGFEDDVKDSGLILPWCNQNMVLSNPAIGGFVTHCGWNSILESMWFGVPMICYPFLVDQPTNRKLVVDDWKIGINLCDGDQITREEVANKVNILMKGQKSIDLRREIDEVSETLRNALDTDGSSQRNFDQFVEDLKGRMCSTKENGTID